MGGATEVGERSHASGNGIGMQERGATEEGGGNEEGRAWAMRVRVQAETPMRGRGRGRAGRPRTREFGSRGNNRARVQSQLTWSTIAYNDFVAAQSNVQGRFERGEGGGVT